MIDILLTQPVPEPIDQQLTADYRVHRLYEATNMDSFLNQVGEEIRGVVTGGSKGLSNEIMARLPNLQIIAISGVGTDAVDLWYARQRGVQVTTTPGVLTEDVADMAMGLLIMTLRDLGMGERLVRAGQWGKTQQPLARQVSGIRLGIVGLGRIGHAIARRATAFNMKVGYFDLHEQPASHYTYVPSLLELAQCSDALIVAASADQAKPIITADVLDALGPQGYLINVARGRLVDEPALVQALIEGRIAGAGLDVFANEPQVPEALLGLERVVLQPHRASATEQTRLAMGAIVLENLRACFQGQPLPSVVNA